MTALRPYVLLAGLFLLAGSGAAQTLPAEDYFNEAAKRFVKEDKTAALRTLERGLREHPGDARLLKLAEELLKDEEQQGGQDQQQENKGEDKNEKNESQDQKENGEQKEEPGQENQGEQRPGEPKPEPGRISPQDAKRILDALERQEKETQAKVREKQRPAQRVPVEKDW